MLYANCFLGLTYGFLNKIFKKLSYLVTGHYLCRGWGGKKEGGVKVILDSQEEGVNLFFIKKFRGVSSLIARYTGCRKSSFL